MKNKFKILNLLFYFVFFLHFSVNGSEQFIFDVTELEISEKGNILKGSKRGIISTNDGLTIVADNFEYNKILNLLNASGKIEIKDAQKNLLIFADKITYFKNNEKIIGENNLRIINDEIVIEANKFEYYKVSNIINANQKVKIIDNQKDILILTDDLTYFRNKEKFLTKGKTEAIIQSKYNFKSNDVQFLKDKMILSSNNKTNIIDDEIRLYKLDKFSYDIKKEFLKATNISINENIKIPKNQTNQLFFKNGFFDLKNQKFVTGKTEIKFKKNLFDNNENDPRLKRASSSSENKITTVNKSIFTSCKNNDKCPPWHIKAKKITHDQNKKQLIYDDAVVKIYDVPVFYFPKFFHPDPSVKRQSGFLQPKFGNSKILGSSFSLPYFYAISHNKDLTFKPTIFDSNSIMYQNEYRQENKKSSLISDFSLTTNFESTETKEKNSISHLFSKFDLNLDFEKFIKSDLNFSLEKVSSDTYLKVFENILSNTDLRPGNNDVLSSEVKLSLDHQNFKLNTGMSAFENLQKKSSDRYQFILPYYDFSTNIFMNNYGTLDFISKGNNDLKNTNNLRTQIINDWEFRSQDKILYDYGAKNSYGIYLKNTNTVGKNDEKYKSDPNVDLKSIFEINASIPMIREKKNYISSLTPKVSLRINPSEMENYSNTNRMINADNIFNVNRLSLDDTFESGESLTYGVNFRNENLENSNKYIELSLASVLRKNEEKKIPKKTTLNKKRSNIFGSMNYNTSKFLKLEYDFSINNNLNAFDYNSLGAEISVNNFVTKFNFIKENNVMGDENSLENTTTYTVNDNNYLSFKTRRNKKINLTEYYDLVYEYKNDCLTAGVKYKKTFYEDRDLKPTENLLFSITLIPLTSFEQKVGQDFYR